MLSQHFKSPSHVQRLLSRPGGSLLEGYSQYLQQRGYAKISVCTHITAASHFLYWSSGELLHEGTATRIGGNAVGLDHRGRRLARPHCPARDDREDEAERLPVVGLDTQARAAIEDDLFGIFFGIPSRCGGKGNIFAGTTEQGHDARGQIGLRRLKQSGTPSLGAKGKLFCVPLRPAIDRHVSRAGA